MVPIEKFRFAGSDLLASGTKKILMRFRNPGGFEMVSEVIPEGLHHERFFLCRKAFDFLGGHG